MITFSNGSFFEQTDKRDRLISLREAVRLRRHADEKAEKVLNRALAKLYPMPPTRLPEDLDAHQKAGVDWILSRQRCYLAHAAGAGKTRTAITAASLCPLPGPVLVVCPPHMVGHWEREIFAWQSHHAWPAVSRVGESAQRDQVFWGADFLIVPDSMLTKRWVLKALVERYFYMVIVDEASRFKEAAADRTRALFGGEVKRAMLISPGLVQGAAHAVLCDASPITSRTMDLWAPIYSMDPETIDCMSRQEFGLRYCGPKPDGRGGWLFKGSSHEADLKAKLTRQFMHVVGEAELGHSERKRSMLLMSEDVRTLEMKKWERTNAGKFELGSLGEEASRGEIARYRKALGMRKVPWIVSYVKDKLMETNESILLFAWHQTVCAQLMNEIEDDFTVAMITGATPMEARERYREQFQKGNLRLIIGNIAAMGRGGNFQKADRAIFAEFSWSDEINKQAEKRGSRKGRDASLPVHCDYVVCPDSLDEMVLRAVFKNERTVKKVIG